MTFGILAVTHTTRGCLKHTSTQKTALPHPPPAPQTWEIGIKQRGEQKESQSPSTCCLRWGCFPLPGRQKSETQPQPQSANILKKNKQTQTNSPPPPPQAKNSHGRAQNVNNSLVPISPDNPINRGAHKFINLGKPGAHIVVWNCTDTHRHRGNLHLSFLTQHTCQALPMHSTLLIDLCLPSLGKEIIFL